MPSLSRQWAPQGTASDNRGRASAIIRSTIRAALVTSLISPTPQPAYMAMAVTSPVVNTVGGWLDQRAISQRWSLYAACPTTSFARAACSVAARRTRGGASGQPSAKAVVRTVSSALAATGADAVHDHGTRLTLEHVDDRSGDGGTVELLGPAR